MVIKCEELFLLLSVSSALYTYVGISFEEKNWIND